MATSRPRLEIQSVRTSSTTIAIALSMAEIFSEVESATARHEKYLGFCDRGILPQVPEGRGQGLAPSKQGVHDDEIQEQ